MSELTPNHARLLATLQRIGAPIHYVQLHLRVPALPFSLMRLRRVLEMLVDAGYLTRYDTSVYGVPGLTYATPAPGGDETEAA